MPNPLCLKLANGVSDAASARRFTGMGVGVKFHGSRRFKKPFEWRGRIFMFQSLGTLPRFDSLRLQCSSKQVNEWNAPDFKSRFH
jgi:hypothetical protein